MIAVNPRPTIAGLKCSQELCLLEASADPPEALDDLLGALAGRGINLSLMLGRPYAGGEGRTALCLRPGDAEGALELARRTAEAHGLAAPRLTRGVALVHFYPLSQDLNLPVAALASLSRQGISPLGLATSLSAVVLLVRREDLAAALDLLARDLNLPEGLSPAFEQVTVVQSPRRREED